MHPRRRLVGLAATWIASFGIGLATSAGAEEPLPLRVALVPVVVHSSDESTDYLSAGLADMLAARLERSGAIHVLRVPDPPESSLVSDAVQAGQEVDAEYVIFGSFTQFGKGASLDIRCAPVMKDLEQAEGAARQVFIQSGSLGEIIPQLGTLAEKVERFLRDGAGPAPAIAGGNGSRDVEDLRRRVEALERVVFIEATGAGAEEAAEDASAEAEDGEPEQTEEAAEADAPDDADVR